MYLLHALPSLLQIVNESEDERAALTGACSWTRRYCGADAAGFLAEDDILASEGFRADTLTPDERRAVVAAATTTTFTRPDGVVVAAPVRYGGVRIAVAVLAGADERRNTLVEAGAALASIVASAVRGRLDALAIGAQWGESGGRHLRPQSGHGRGPRRRGARARQRRFRCWSKGESGTGKELVARALHRLSAAARPAVLPRSTARRIADELVEAELFGHARGAFTGAVGAARGPVRGRARRHAVSRRGRRAVAARAGQAAARAAGARNAARGRERRRARSTSA